ncbi:hypothetical protein [Paenibacillus cymbidii]|uniref:hypothetical protein n=1 Tax=Paenibacillus cymbidii TaxID=1639034 RepID=UPI00108035CB|nr:hypothetical protein [Paenibacillus cymbidii]
MNRNEIEVVIDELTPCLIHRESGEEYTTIIETLKKSDLNRLTKEQGGAISIGKRNSLHPIVAYTG